MNVVPKAKVSSTTHVQLLQWLHGKQQQQGDNILKDRYLVISPLRLDKFGIIIAKQ